MDQRSEEQRIEQVARAMAKARYGYEEHPPSQSPPGMRMMANSGMVYSGDPAWQKHLTDAKCFVAAFDVLRLD